MWVPWVEALGVLFIPLLGIALLIAAKLASRRDPGQAASLGVVAFVLGLLCIPLALYSNEVADAARDMRLPGAVQLILMDAAVLVLPIRAMRKRLSEDRPRS